MLFAVLRFHFDRVNSQFVNVSRNPQTCILFNGHLLSKNINCSYFVYHFDPVEILNMSEKLYFVLNLPMYVSLYDRS